MFLYKIILCIVLTNNFIFCMEADNAQKISVCSVIQRFFGEHAQDYDWFKNYPVEDAWYLDKQFAPDSDCLVNSLCFNPTNDSLAIGCTKGKAYIYELQTNEQTLLTQSSISIEAVSISPSGKYLALGHYRPYMDGGAEAGKTVLFDLVTKKKILSAYNREGVNCVTFDPSEKYIATGTNAGELNINEIERNERPKKRFKESFTLGPSVTSACFHPKEKLLAAGSTDKKISIINTDTWKTIATYPCGPNVHTIAYSPCGNYLAAGCGYRSKKGKCSLFDVNAQKNIMSFSYQGSVATIAFHPSGKLLAVGVNYDHSNTTDITVHIINLHTQKEIFSYSNCCKERVSSLAFDIVGNYFAIGLYKTVLVYNHELITLNQLALRKLLSLWFSIKHQHDALQNIDFCCIKTILLKLAKDFYCNTSELETIWDTLPLRMQSSITDTINKLISFHKAPSEQQFLAAIKKNDLDTVRILLERGIDINAKSTHKDDAQAGALHLAIKEFEQNSSPLTFEYEQKTSESLALLKSLIEHGADINVTNKYGKTPLSYALCYHPWENAAELLIAHNATMPTHNDGSTMLHYAAEEGFTKAVSMLLEKDKSLLNRRDHFGNTALMVACSDDHPAVVRLLLEAGALASQ